MLWPNGTYPHPQRIQIGSKDGEWLWVIKEEMECGKHARNDTSQKMRAAHADFHANKTGE